MKGIMIYLDGAMIFADQKLLKSLSPGILKGDGVFETMRSYGARQDQRIVKIFQLALHLSRLARGLKALNIPPPISLNPRISVDAVGFNFPGKEIIEKILRLNNLVNAKVRLTVWKSGKKIHSAITVVPYKPFSENKYKKGFSAMVSRITLDESSMLNGIKSIRYDFFLKAYQRARLHGYDEALLFNRRGELVEGSRSNIFFVTDKVLCTPPLRSGCLAGITRQLVIKIAGEMGIEIKQRKVTLFDILEAREVFLTNSLLEVMPLTSIEGKDLNGGKAGKLTLQILKEYRIGLSRLPVKRT